MDARKYPITLDLGVPNCKLPFELYQGSQDLELEVTLTSGGNILTVGDAAEVEVTAVYECNKGAFVFDKNDPNFNITVSDNKITIPFVEGYVTASGLSRLVLKVVDGITAYTFDMSYKVVVNPAYQPTSTPDNLPTYNKLATEVAQLTTTSNTHTQEITDLKSKTTSNSGKINTNTGDVAQAKSDIVTNSNTITQHTIAIANKADKDLTNVEGFVNTENNHMFYKAADGSLQDSGIEIDSVAKVVDFPYTIKTLPGSVKIGSVKLSENGAFLENIPDTTLKHYLMLDYENDKNTGSTVPVYWERGSKQINVKLQDVATQVMTNKNKIALGYSTDDHQTQAVYFNFLQAVTNFRFKITVAGRDIAHYPSKRAYLASTPEEKALYPGYNLGVGIQKVELMPFWTTLKEYNRGLEFVADSVVSMLGNGTVPYLAIDMNAINRYDVALAKDITGQETAEELARKLETLTLNLRLDASAIKNLPTGSSSDFTSLDDTPSDYTGMKGKMLVVNAAETGLEFIDSPTTLSSIDGGDASSVYTAVISGGGANG